MLSAGGNSRVKLAKRAEIDDHQDKEETEVERAADVKVRGYVGFEGGSSFGGPQRDGRFRGRGRVSEFRPSRGGRGSGRGRGGFPPRGDREPPDSTAKYNEPLAHSNPDSWSQGNSSNKHYDRSDVVVNLPEDPRISKLLRRLCAELDIEKSLAICSKLQEAVMMPENARYIRRSYDILVESLLDVFYDAPSPETKENAAIVLGRMGFVMEHDYRKHLEWIGSTYEVHNNSIKHLLIFSLSETFNLDSQTPTLGEFSNLTLNKLQAIIERTDSADVFIAAINVMIIMSESYPEHFANHFVDTVDILVGWHVDNAQTKQVNFALKSLLKLSRHWQADVRFSINLLTQFVEDMVAYSNDLDPNHQNEDSEANPPEECKQKITSFLNVFNTVVKSLGTLFSPNVSPTVSWSLLTDITTKILQVLIKAIDYDTSTDLITAGNECIILLLDYLQAKSHSCSPLIFQLISLEMNSYLQSGEEICLSILNLISKAIKEISLNLSIEFIIHIVGPGSLLRPLRYSESSKILEGTMLVYSNLLNLKNIPLLQETYKFVLTDLQNAYCVIVPDIAIIQPEYSENMSAEDAEKNVIFYLQCLSELANASNSIIGMWALQPSILELLAIKMSPYNENIIRDRPALQYSILYLLYSHCKKNNHFIASSDLVTNTQQRANDIFGLSNLTINDVTGSSPTSGHLAVILNLLAVILDRQVSNDILILVLNWIGDIFSQLDKYLPNVCRSEGFLVLVTNMLTNGHCFDNDIIALVLKNLQPLLKNKNIQWNAIVLKNIAILCLLHIDNRDKGLSKLCADVLIILPWDIVQLELDKQKFTIFTTRKISHNILTTDTKLNSFKDYLTRCCYGNLSNDHFKMIMNCLLQPYFGDGYFLINTFLTAWPLESQDMDTDMLIFFRQCVTNFSSISTGWCLSEIAQTCVSLKLRTILGKPQETFMKIEGALKGIARETSSLETKYSSTEKYSLIEVIIAEQIRSRWIIEFMMFLEKYVYNAAEGTAVVFQPVAKQVRTFFHTNWPTCREWLTRVRPAGLAVSLYSGNYGAAIYHAQLILQNAANSTTNMDIEAITMSVARALIKFKEPEVLLGLYIWIKQTFDKKFHWLKAVAEQANSRYDLALEYYKKIAASTASSADKNDSGEVPPSETRYSRFIDEQVTDCYKYIQNWDDMIAWKDQESNKKKTTQWDSFTALKTFEDSSELPAELCDWDVLDVRGKDALKNSFSYQNTLNKIESALVFTAVSMCYSDDVSKYDNLLTDCETLLQSSFEELNRNNAVYFLKETAVLQLANQGLKAMVKNGKMITNPFQPSNIKEHKYGTELENLAKIHWWNQYFTKFNITEENIFYAECLRLDVIKSARKNCNYSMAKRELVRHFKNNSSFQVFLGSVSSLEELQETMLLSGNAYEFDIWSLNNATALVELCKLTYGMDEDKTLAINLCASVSLAFSQRLAMGEQNYELREKGTRMLLTLSKWVQNENENILVENDSSLAKLILALPEIGLVDNNISENVIPVSDSAVGKLLQIGVNQCPGLAKAWASFASWCFRWGRKMVEFSSKTGEKLTDNDKIQIENVMIGCSAQDFEAVCDILSKTKASCDDEDIDWNEINTSAMIETQLRSVPSLCNAFPEHIALLVDIWRQAQKRVFSYFELSADAYFKFLQLICASDYINHSGEYAVVSATLRLLRLIVKHAMELQTVLESGLANTPTQPWKVIIPQLFSRLNHPETYVRKCVSDLLCRLAEDTPHLITFPAVVGAVENEQNNIAELSAARSYIHDDDDGIAQESFATEDHSDKVISNDMNSCFLDMVETLSKQAPQTILQVKMLVRELQRINLLWDELWLGTLAQHHSDFTKRLAMLESEIIKVKDNAHLSTEEKEQLIKEKHHIIFDPIVFVLQQINHITSVAPDTPHEIAFQNKFQYLIDEAIDKLKNPPNPEKPQESWQPLKQLQIKLQQKVNKRTSYILKMCDISPTLAELKNTVITMPGVHTHQRTVRIKIRAIENNVAILPTKTRPKKLVFYGSDGKVYTYLFKGLEDLHLDERIMQLLSITNTMLARDSENNDNQTYRARHYSVIPLGPRSGLISWVENVTPLFALYKRWQNREAAILTVKNNRTVSVARPSELFYTKLNPLLKEAGVSTENRKEWPVSILRQVLSELAAETPKDLLWRELWCGSVNSEQWWQMVRRYSYSVAVMSIIGYIIGLGDRHLDNVLVDLTSGEVVHIDYNVCFEKGKTLRVPEKVPFRMTPNLVTALGVTGVEGIFRLACEHVLRVMRRGRETLLTLLEAFVYDPLVEWGGAAGNTGHKRKKSQRDAKAALAMLAVRSTEYRHQLLDNTEKFLAELPEFMKIAEKWLQENEELKNLETRLQECHQQLALIKEIEAYGNNLSEHPLYAKSTKYTAYKQAKNAVEDSMKTIIKMLKEYDSQIETYVATTEDLNGPQFMAWVQEFANPNEDDDVRIFDHLKDFLTNAGQSALLTQCEQAEAELMLELKETGQQIRHCLELLSQYLAMSQYYPQTRTEYHRIVMFRKWLAAILESKSPEVCREVAKQMQALVNADNIGPNSKAAQQILEYQYRLQAICSETNEALAKATERLDSEGGPDGVILAQEAYREAKASLSNWVRTEEGASQALESVVIGMLCNVNRRYLNLENGAQSAGDCLVDLTSRDGEWFLDEMNYLSIQAVELLSLLPLQQASAEDPAIPLAVDCVRNMNLLLSDLIQLNYNFSTIILPELLKKVHSEDPSTLMLIADLNAVVLATPISLNELLQQLDVHYRYLVMDMESPASNALLIAADLRTRFEALLASNTEEGAGVGGGSSVSVSSVSSVGSAGVSAVQALCGWLGAMSARAQLVTSHVAAPLPPAWRKVDQLHDTMRLCAALQSAAVRTLVEQRVFVLRVQCVLEVLTLCAGAAHGFTSLANNAPYSPQAYCNVIRRFTAEFVSRCCLGVGSRALAVTLCLLLRRGVVDLAAAIEQKEIGASWSVSLESLCALSALSVRDGGGCESGAGVVGAGAARARAERVCACARVAARAAHTRREHAARLAHHRLARDMHAAHAHLHAQVVGGAAAESRAAMSRAGRRLSARLEKLTRARDSVRRLLHSAHMRVKWGAGANPALRSLESVVLSSGARTLGAAALTLRAAHTLARAVTTRAHTHRPDRLQAHAQHTMQACIMAQKHALDVTPVEESLMEMLHPEGNIDQHWVQSVSALVTDMLSSVTRSLNTFGTKPVAKSTTKTPSTKSAGAKGPGAAAGGLALCRATRMALCGEFRPTLLTLQAHAHGPNPVSEYITREQAANDQIRLIVDVLDRIAPTPPDPGPKDAASAVRDGSSASKDGTNTAKDGANRFKDGANEDEVRAALAAAEFLQEELPALTDLLLQLSSKWSTSLTRPLSRQPAITAGSHHGGVAGGGGVGGGGGGGGGGAGVWRRVLHKLEGRHDSARRSPRDLVDHIIAEATNIDNLCLMYEGWMAWV